MSLESAFAQAEATHLNRVLSSTWGHLHPEPRRKYRGYLVFACGAYRDVVILYADFQDLPDSPWFYEDMQQFVADKTRKEDPAIFRFDGTYTKLRNGRCRFSGRVARTAVTSRKLTGKKG